MFDNIMKSVKKLCNDDEACIICVLVIAGLLLCMLLNNRSGFSNFPFANGEGNGSGSGSGSDSGSGSGNGTDPQEVKVGQVLKERAVAPPASIAKKIALARAVPRPEQQAAPGQKPGLLTQDATIFKPFDEVWNPGFMPLDMVFKGAVGTVGNGNVPVAGPATGPKGVRGVAAQNGGLLDTVKNAFTGSQEPEVKGVESAPENELKMILVYAPWCGHSKKMLPDYEKVKSEFHGKTVNNSKVSVVMYNSDVDKAKVKEYQVKGFPSLFVEKNGELSPFPHRTYDKISAYINDNA